MSTIDLDKPPPQHVYTVSVEPEESRAERYVRLFKDIALFLVAVGFVIAIAIICFRTLYEATSTSDEKKWAMSVLSAAAGGMVGYLIRK